MLCIQHWRPLPLLSLHAENSSATVACCCFYRVSGAQVWGPEAVLAGGDGTRQVCCWWVFEAAVVAACAWNWCWSMFGETGLPLANGQWCLSLGGRTSLALVGAAWSSPSSSGGVACSETVLLGLLGHGAAHLQQPLLAQDGLGKQHVGRGWLLLSLNT